MSKPTASSKDINNAKYFITLKGLIGNNKIYDRIELYMLRFGFNGIVLHDEKMTFEKLEVANAN